MLRAIASSAFLALGLISSAREAHAQSPGASHASQLLAFHQYVGKHAADDMARAKGVTFTLGANGAFRMSLPNTWYGTISGVTTHQGSVLAFHGLRTLKTGVGHNFAYIDGVISKINGVTYLEYVSESGNSVAAVVNGSNFGSSASNVYYAGLSIR